MPFFVKLTTQAKSWGWCYAEAVRRTSGVITLSGVHAPIFGAKSLSIFQGDYPWAIENGWLHAYPVRTELPWSQTRAGAVVYPSFIPERIVREGLDAAVEFALRAPVLRAVFSDEAVRRCAAEDQILDHEIAKLRSPCFLPPNDQEIVRWAGLRPSAFAHASADADRIVSEQHLGGVRATARRRLRMEAHSANAERLAHWLAGQPQVARVHYAGLPSHPQHALAARQQRAFGGVLSFELKGGREEAWRFIDATRLLSITANLGDAKSTITHPASTTHGRLSPEAKAAAGISEALIRIAVGLEDIGDIERDCARGFAALQG